MLSEFFTQDHQEIGAMLASLSQGLGGTGADADALAELSREIHRRLRRHIQWEEALLFPAVEAKSPDLADGPGRVMREEHTEILANLQELESLLTDDASSDAARTEGRRLLHAIEAVLDEHNEKEEGIYYPLCDELLSDAETADLMGQLTADA